MMLNGKSGIMGPRGGGMIVAAPKSVVGFPAVPGPLLMHHGQQYHHSSYHHAQHHQHHPIGAAVVPPGGLMGMRSVGAHVAPPGPPQPTPAARIAAFEAAILADPYDVTAWDGRLAEAVREGRAAPVFERAVVQFPTSARIWTAYAEWCEGQDPQTALSVFKRCRRQIPSIDLWVSYVTFCKRYQPLEDIFRAYQDATDLLGTDCRAGLLWSEYLGLLKRAYNLLQKKQNPEAEVSGRLLQEDPNIVEAARRALKPALRKKVEESKLHDISEEEFVRVGEALHIDFTVLRAAYQNALSSPHATMDKLWHGYEQFEKSLGNSPLAQKLISDHMPRYVRAKTAFKDLQALNAGLDHFAMAIPIRPENAKAQQKLLEKWRSVMNFERANHIRLPRPHLQARLSLVYQQAALSCAFHAEIWYEFSSWLDLGGQPEKATACLRHAVERFLPQDLTLRLLIAHRCELAITSAKKEETLRAADDEFQRLLDDAPKPCPLALVNYLSFVRRQRGAAEFRDAFLEATESSPHCTWETYVFVALTEYHVFGSSDAASKVFRIGMERYGDREPSLVVAYVNFLISTNDLKSARAELSRGVLERMQAGVRDQLANRSDKMVRDSLAFLWQKWARLERYFGDVGAVKRAMTFRDEEYRNLQRDQEVDEETIAETPLSLGLSTSIVELEESFRFQHLVSRSSRAAPESPTMSETATPVQHVAKPLAPESGASSAVAQAAATSPGAATGKSAGAVCATSSSAATQPAASADAAAGGAAPGATPSAAEPKTETVTAEAATTTAASTSTAPGDTAAGNGESSSAAETESPAPAAAGPATSPPATSPGVGASSSETLVPSKQVEFFDQAVTEAVEDHRRLGSATPAGLSAHVVRPDVSKMLAFRPALDIVGRKRPAPADTAEQGQSSRPSQPAAPSSTGVVVGGSVSASGGGSNTGDDGVGLPTMIPKCLQDLLAVLPSRPLKGARPDVDYLLTVLQTVKIPPVPVKELEHFRYDSLRLAKEEDDNSLLRKLMAKDEMDGSSVTTGGFFSSRPTLHRDRLQAKRQKVMAETQLAKMEAGTL